MTNTPSSTTTGLLSDGEAFTIYRALQSEQNPERAKPMAQALGTYRDAKAKAGLRPFQEAPDAAAARQTRFESLYSGLDGVETQLAPEQRTQLDAMLKTVADPQEAKARMVNLAYVRSFYPETDATLVEQNWPAVKRTLAKQVLGLDKPEVSDRELFTGIGGRMKQQAAERVMLTSMVQKVTQSAFDGTGSWLEAYKAASVGMAGEGFNPANVDRYRAAAKQAFEAAAPIAAKLRPLADNITMSLARIQETRDGFEGVRGFTMDELVRMVASVPDEERPILYAMIAKEAQTSLETADAKDKGIGKQTGEAVGRGVMDVLRAQKAALADNPGLVHATMLAEAADHVSVVGKRRPGESLVDWASRSMPGNYGIVDFAKDVVLQKGQPFLRDRRVLTEAEQTALKEEVATLKRETAIRRELRQIAEGVIDPIVGSNFFTEKIYYPAIQNAAYTAQAFVPYAGIPLLITSTKGMREQEMMDRGVPVQEATKLALASALIEAPVEFVQSKLLVGKLPLFEKLLMRPVTTVGKLTGRAATVFGLELAEQNLQEAVQDATPLIVQHVASVFSESVPDVNWQKELGEYAKGRVDTFWSLIPMVLIGTGSATFKDAAYGRQYLNSLTTLKAAGFTEETAQRILAAPTVEEKEAIVRDSWNDERLRAMNGEAQQAAFTEMEADLRSSYQEQDTGVGARIVRLEDGTFEVLDAQGEAVDITTTPEAALELAREVNAADNVNLEQAITDLISYFDGIAEPGSTIEMVGDRRGLQDKVDAGEITDEEAQRAVDVAVSLGQLQAGTRVADVITAGENVTRYDARTGLFEDVSRIYEGATPLTVVEEKAEGYLKRRIEAGDVQLEDVQRWRESMDGPQKDNSSRALIEWFSTQAKAYMVGNAEEQAIPATFRAFLRRLKEYFAEVLKLAQRLTEMERSGKLEDGFRTHLARAVGLDQAWIERRMRLDERGSAVEQRQELGVWLRGRLPHPDTAKENGEPLAGELRDLFNGMRSPQFARAYFAPKGKAVELDRVVESAQEAGFSVETPAELLAKLDDAQRGIATYATPQEKPQTFALESAGRADEIKRVMRERRVSERISTGEHAGDLFDPVVRERLAARMYEVVPLESTVQDALRIVGERGVDDVMRMVLSDGPDVPRSTQVALGIGLIEHFNDTGKFDAAVQVAERVAELGTELGRAVNAFKLLGRVLDTPEKAQVFFARQVKKAEVKAKEKQPAIDGAKAVALEVQREARKLLRTWLDEINGVTATPRNRLKPARVEDLPAVTFSLTAEQKASGIVSVVARMLKESGAEATEKALLEKYGDAVEPHLADIFIEAQKLLSKRKAPRRAPGAEQGKPYKRRTKEPQDAEDGAQQGTESAMTDEEIDRALDELRQANKWAPIQMDMTAIDEHFRGKRMTWAQVEATLADARAMGLLEEQTQLAGLEDLVKRLQDEVIDRMKVRNLETPEAVRDALRRLFEKHALRFTAADIDRVFADKFKLPALTDEQAKRLGELAKNIASTPDGSAERTDATIALMDYVNERLKDVDVVERAWAVWYANVLSGYNTHFRNLYGNFVSLALELPLSASGINPLDVLHRLKEMVTGVGRGARLGAQESKEALATGRTSILKSEDNKFRAGGVLERRPFAGGNANPLNWLKVVMRALSAEDLFAFATAQEARARMVAWEMAKQKGIEGDALNNEVERLLNNTETQLADFGERAALEWDELTDELKAKQERGDWIRRRVEELRLLQRDAALIERASEFAARATFNYKPDGFVGVVANALMDYLARASAIEADTKRDVLLKAVATSPKLVFPFIRIAANILNRGIDYSGAGVVRFAFDRKLTYDPRRNFNVGLEAKSADERMMELSRGLFGLALMGVISALASPDDDDAFIQIHGGGSGSRDRNMALNGPQWMPYSVEIRTATGSRFVTFQYTPLAVGLAILGNWHDSIRYKRFNEKEQHERLAAAMIGAGQVLLDQSFMANAADLLNLLGRDAQTSERALFTFLGRTFNPAVAVPFSNLIRNIEADFDPVRRDTTSIGAALQSYVPVARRWNAPALDVLGDELQNRPFDWFTKAERDGTPEARIYAVFAEKNISPSNIWSYKGRMEPEQFYNFTKARGQFIKDELLKDGERQLKALAAQNDENAKAFLEDLSQAANDFAKARVGYVPKPPGLKNQK